ncbi:MAG TPA: hypothetical protein VI685_20625 [Candidatus Angelobacter sp.]
MLTRVDYEASVCARLSEADHVPLKFVSLGDWQPEVGDCHRNVDRWVEANPGAAGVRGWVAHVSYGTAIGLTAHSVVRGQDGQLFDITPLKNEYYRKTMRFIPHIGDDETFFAMVKMGIEIRCPCELNLMLPEL